MLQSTDSALFLASSAKRQWSLRLNTLIVGGPFALLGECHPYYGPLTKSLTVTVMTVQEPTVP